MTWKELICCETTMVVLGNSEVTFLGEGRMQPPVHLCSGYIQCCSIKAVGCQISLSVLISGSMIDLRSNGSKGYTLVVLVQLVGAVEYPDTLQVSWIWHYSIWSWGFNNDELWMRSTPSLPLLPGPLWPRVVAPDRVLFMDQIELNCTCAKLNSLK